MPTGKPRVLSLVSAVLEGLVPSSVEAYERSWHRWKEAGGPVLLKDFLALDVAQLEQVRGKLQAKYKPATSKRCFVVAHKIWRTLKATEGRFDPFSRVKLRIGDNVPEWNVLQKGELKKLSDALLKVRAHHVRAIVLALGLQGWRLHVLTQLTWADLHQDERGWYAEFRSKRGAIRRQRVHSEVMLAVEKVTAGEGNRAPKLPFLPWRDGSPLTKMRIYRAVTSMTQKHLGHRATPHGLRATFISDVIQRRGIEAARQLAGQKSINTTVRYSRWVIVDDEEVPL